MLSKEIGMNTHKNSPIITWNDDELELIATELKRQNPSRLTDSYFRFEFTTMEVEDAAEAILPQERHRAVESFDDIRRSLFNAFERLKMGHKVVPSNHKFKEHPSGHIFWEPSEWEDVIAEMLRIKPDLPESEFQGLSMAVVNAANLVLPIPRRRHFKQLVAFRPQCHKMHQQIQAHKKDLPPPIVVEFKSGPIMEPEATKKDHQSVLATAMHKAFQAAPEEEKKKRQYISWSNQEWREVATEMCRQNPHADFFRNSFSVIDLAALRDAQREVLPLERRRPLKNTTGLQPQLVAAFKALSDERSHAQVYEEPVAQPAMANIETVYDKFTPGFEVKPTEHLQTVQEQHVTVTVEQIPAVQPAPAIAVSGDFLTRLSTAAMPMMGVIVAELAKQLAPEVAKIMAPELAKLVSADVIAAMFERTQPLTNLPNPGTAIYGGASQAAVKVEEARPTRSQLAALMEVPAPKVKKPKIALLGPMGSQKHELELAYPDLEIIFIEQGHGIKEACRNSEFFIASNKHAPAGIRNQIKKFSKSDCMRYVEGSISSFKHQIDIWKASKA